MVVFFDIDGTIVDDATQIIPESTREAIRRLKARGDPRLQNMDFGAWVCACGMEVILDGAYLHRDYPSEQVCHWVAQTARECGMLIQAEAENRLYQDATMTYTGAPALEAERLRQRGIPTVSFQDAPDFSFVKFVTHDAPGCRREAFRQAMAPHFDGIIRSGTMIEFVKAGNSKARGMERLLKKLNIPVEQTFAVGDSTNDLPMFSMAGTTICLGGGMEELKKEADFVTDTVLRDGVYHALRHYDLI